MMQLICHCQLFFISFRTNHRFRTLFNVNRFKYLAVRSKNWGPWHSAFVAQNHMVDLDLLPLQLSKFFDVERLGASWPRLKYFVEFKIIPDHRLNLKHFLESFISFCVIFVDGKLVPLQSLFKCLKIVMLFIKNSSDCLWLNVQHHWHHNQNLRNECRGVTWNRLILWVY